MISKGPTVQFEWLFETINKRMGAPYFIKLEDLFLCVPYPEESAFDYELSTAFNNFGVSQGIVLERDYPNLYQILGHARKSSLLKVFLLKPHRIKAACVLWHKKYTYPKISICQSPKVLLFNKAMDNINKRKKALKISLN